MLTHHHKPVCLSIISTDLPVWSVVETPATLYQKDSERFHLLLTAPPLISCEADNMSTTENAIAPIHKHLQTPPSPRVLWLEISPYRITMTMQGNTQISYRHFWEKGVYGISRYWLSLESLQPYQPICLRNFTTELKLTGKILPENLRIDYELWSQKLQLGRYILNLEIHH